MVASLAAALVVQERWVLGVHLFLDDAFLGYVAWLARRAEIRNRAAAPPPPPAAPAAPGSPHAPELTDAPETEEEAETEEATETEEEEEEVTDARA